MTSPTQGIAKLASKWRALVRAGRLSSRSLAELKDMGLLHTPQALAKEVAGIERGNEALLARYSSTQGLRNYRSPKLSFRHAQLVDMGYDDETGKLLATLATPLPQVGKKSAFQKAVATRHEIDEFRGLVKNLKSAEREAARRNLPIVPLPDSVLSRIIKLDLPLRDGGHISPAVILNETGHLSFATPSMRKSYYRTPPGSPYDMTRKLEQSAINSMHGGPPSSLRSMGARYQQIMKNRNRRFNQDIRDSKLWESG